MNNTGQELTDHKMEMLIGNLLRAGVVAAASVVLLGGIIYLFRHGSALADYKVFQRGPSDLRRIGGILSNAFSGHGRGFIQLGLLLLIATPVARVMVSIFVFARKRDTLYVIVTLSVFCILIYSLFGGR
ncbi:DUF1634 domain-containing protein [bacterium]|nr:MAG: DUF1634 domain-containing protein [bacterium]